MALAKKRSERARKVRYAVVGLGYIAQSAVLPAFRNARRNSELAALVSGTPEKLRRLGARYGVRRTYSYEQYDDCLRSGEIDAVYIALPNSMHREYAERAARAGIHVLCEKPMAVTEPDCEKMIAAARRGRVKLMIAYRLHFEEANLAAIELVRSRRLGDPRIFSSVFTMQVKRGNSRLRRGLGGGTLYDLGIYCINAARYLFQSEPTHVLAVAASSRDARFREVEEMTSGILRFPGERLASFTSSFGAADAAAFQVIGTKGRLEVEAAYEYAERIEQRIKIGDKLQKRSFPKRDQFGPELIYFSDCVLTGRDPEPSGEEGLADLRVMRALYQSARTGRVIKVSGPARKHRPSRAQEIHCPPCGEPRLVRASSPGA